MTDTGTPAPQGHRDHMVDQLEQHEIALTAARDILAATATCTGDSRCACADPHGDDCADGCTCECTCPSYADAAAMAQAWAAIAQAAASAAAIHAQMIK